jgi:hypothetical protein
VGWGALEDVDGMLRSSGAGSAVASEVDGLARAAHTSTTPIMASPTAIKALTSQLARQLDELNISFDPLVDAVPITLRAARRSATVVVERTQSLDARSVAQGLGTIR